MHPFLNPTTEFLIGHIPFDFDSCVETQSEKIHGDGRTCEDEKEALGSAAVIVANGPWCDEGWSRFGDHEGSHDDGRGLDHIGHADAEYDAARG